VAFSTIVRKEEDFIPDYFFFGKIIRNIRKKEDE